MTPNVPCSHILHLVVHRVFCGRCVYTSPPPLAVPARAPTPAPATAPTPCPAEAPAPSSAPAPSPSPANAGTSGTSPPTPPTQALASSSVVDVPDEDGNVPREGHFLAFVVHGEPRENIRVAECVDNRGSKITVWHYVDVSSGFDLRKPLQVRKLAGEHGAGPDTHGNYRNGVVDPVGQGQRNFYRLKATYNVGGTKGVSTSDEHGTVGIIVD